METIAITGALRWLRGGGWKLVAGALTALAIAGTIWWLTTGLSAARTDLKAAQATIDARDGEIVLLRRAAAADSHSIEVRTIYRDRVAQQTIARKEKTDEALKANPDWASEPVPVAVVDSLRP